MTAEVSRRAVLAGGAALGLAACSPATAAPYPGALLGADVRRGHRLRDAKGQSAFPPPSGAEERIPLVIAGGGVAGLAAGWRLAEAGFGDFALLELAMNDCCSNPCLTCSDRITLNTNIHGSHHSIDAERNISFLCKIFQ